MKKLIWQNVQTSLKGIPKRKEIHYFKIIYFVSLAIGFGALLFLGKDFPEMTKLLDSESLIGIRDNDINKNDFFGYILSSRTLLLAAGIFFWWWNLGKMYLCIAAAGLGAVMGSCLHICFLRYPLTGLLLWFMLYFPHMLFYAGAIFCGIILSSKKLRGREEKLKYLHQKEMLVLILLGLYALAVYAEAYWNVPLLQMFLQYF